MAGTRRVDISGMTFGRWSVLRPADRSGRTRSARWLCRCCCGTERVVSGTSLRGGHSKSCGCLMRELAVQRTTRHGQSNSDLYLRWIAMKDRCGNPNNDSYEGYGGRGIRVCEQWKSFDQFFVDMGPTYEKHLQLERRDNNGDYCPENCFWATPKQQGRNKRNTRRISHNGKSLTLMEWSEICGIDHRTIRYRLSLGWSPARAIETPPLHAAVNAK